MEKSFKAGDVVVLRNGTIVDDLVEDDDVNYQLYSSKCDLSWTKKGEYLVIS